jgi:hypothetical protein
MNFNMTKIAAAVVLSTAAMSAQAVDAVVSMTITEVGQGANAWLGGTAHVGNNVGAGTAAGTSGGAFYFVGFTGPIADGSGTGAIGFGSAVNGIVNGTQQSTFGASFDFGTNTFTPNSCGNTLPCAVGSGLAATVNGTDTITIDMSQWGGFFSAGNQFSLDPEDFSAFGAAAANLNLEVHNSALGAGGLAANQFYFSIDWAHEIQSADGDVTPSTTDFNGFIADWHIEGIGTVAAVPEASTYGMMLAGLGLVGFAVRRRNRA